MSEDQSNGLVDDIRRNASLVQSLAWELERWQAEAKHWKAECERVSDELDEMNTEWMEDRINLIESHEIRLSDECKRMTRACDKELNEHCKSWRKVAASLAIVSFTIGSFITAWLAG